MLCVARAVLYVAPIWRSLTTSFFLPAAAATGLQPLGSSTVDLKAKLECSATTSSKRHRRHLLISVDTLESCCRRVKELDASLLLQLVQVSRGRTKAALGHGAALAHQLHHHLRRSGRGPHPGPGGASECHRRISMRACCYKRRLSVDESVGLGTPAARSVAGTRYLGVRWRAASALHAAQRGGFAPLEVAIQRSGG